MSEAGIEGATMLRGAYDRAHGLVRLKRLWPAWLWRPAFRYFLSRLPILHWRTDDGWVRWNTRDVLRAPDPWPEIEPWPKDDEERFELVRGWLDENIVTGRDIYWVVRKEIESLKEDAREWMEVVS